MPSKFLLGRLPPLHSLGKACSVDFGDDLPFTESPDDSSPTPLDSSGTSRGAYDVSYGPEEAEATAAALGNCFRLVQPGNHVIKRSGRGCDDNDIRFIHSRRAVDLGRKHRDLQLLLTGRAHLHFLRDCVMRIQAVQSFTFYLQDLVKCELLTWHRIVAEDVSSPVESRLDCLSAICEDLRVHVNHWRMTQQRHLTDKWLQMSSRLSNQIRALRSVYARLESTAIWWVGQFISIGLRVLAHYDLSRVSQSDLWQITKGVEEFNAIVSMSSNSIEYWRTHLALHRLPFPSSMATPDAPLLFPPARLCNDHMFLTHPSLTHLALSTFLSAVISPVPVAHLLNVLANERAKYIAAMIHRVVTSNAELRAMASHSHHVSFNWESLLSPDENPPSGTTSPVDAVSTTHSAAKAERRRDAESGTERQRRRDDERRRVRAPSPTEAESCNGKTSDYWSATTCSSGSGVQTQITSRRSSVANRERARCSGVASKASLALDKASARISAAQASKIHEATLLCVEQIVTMARFEEDFASEFLTTVSHCTTLMHKPSWQDSTPMRTIAKAGLLKVESMLPQQIPLPTAGKGIGNVSFVDEDDDEDVEDDEMESDSTIDVTNESHNFVAFSENQRLDSVMPPIEDAVQKCPALIVETSTDVTHRTLVVDSSSEIDEAVESRPRNTNRDRPASALPHRVRGGRGARPHMHLLQVPGADSAHNKSLKKKTVSWSDSADLSLKLRLTGHFMDMLWLSVGKHLAAALHDLRRSRADTDGEESPLLGHAMLLDDVIVVTLGYTISKLCAKDSLPPGALLILEKVSQQLLLCRASASWDEMYCSAAASSQADKGQPIPLVGIEPLSSEGRKTRFGSATGKKFRDAFQPIIASLSLVCSRLSDAGDSTPTSSFSVQEFVDVLKLFSRLVVTVGASANWLYTKTCSYLSSWSVAQFLLTTQNDLKMIVDCVNGVAALEHRAFIAVNAASAGCLVDSEVDGTDKKESNEFQVTNPSDSSNQRLLVEFLQKLSAQLATVSEDIKALSTTAALQFSSRFKLLAAEFFSESLPDPRIWRKKASINEVPVNRSKYIEEAVVVLLLPVVDGGSKLPTEARISSLSVAVTALGEEWMKVFLKQKIRVSLYGANQLEVDFRFLRDWLDEKLNSTTVRRAIFDLEVFAYIRGVCACLSRQPPAGGGRKVSRGSPSRREGLMSISGRSHRVCVIGDHVQGHMEPHSSPKGTTVLVPPLADRLSPHLTNGGAINVRGTSQQSLLGVEEDSSSGVSPKLQPKPRVKTSSSYNNSAVEEDPHAARQIDDADEDADLVSSLPDAEDWLALRVVGGARRWSLPNFPKLKCFSAASSAK